MGITYLLQLGRNKAGAKLLPKLVVSFSCYGGSEGHKGGDTITVHHHLTIGIRISVRF